MPALAAVLSGLSGTATAAAVNASQELTTANVIVAFATIKPILNTGLCVTSTGSGLNNQQILSPCSGAREQSWAINQLGGRDSTVFQFQNRATLLCFSIHVDPFNGELVQYNGCTNSDGSGDPVSNTEWDTNPLSSLPSLGNGPVMTCVSC